MELQEFVNSHPLIKWSAIEKQLGITIGTIRVGGKSINEKYVTQVEALLVPYGYNRLFEVSENLEVPILKPRSLGPTEGFSKEVTDNMVEMEKCKKDPEYFYKKYCLVNGEPPVVFSWQKKYFEQLAKPVPTSTNIGQKYLVKNDKNGFRLGILDKKGQEGQFVKQVPVDGIWLQEVEGP